jgi:oligopeptidase B
MRLGAILAFPTLILGCKAPEETPVQGLEPPVADRIEHWVDGATTPRLDEYYWIRDDSRSNPKVLALLEAENAYGSKLMAASQALQQRLFE